MRSIRNSILPLLLLTLLAILVASCDKASTPPEPIAVVELPGALGKTFATAKPEIKELVSKLNDSLKTQNYPKAYGEIQVLAATSGLNKEQSTLMARGVLCLNTALQNAQASGDAKAAETLRHQRANK